MNPEARADKIVDNLRNAFRNGTCRDLVRMEITRHIREAIEEERERCATVATVHLSEDAADEIRAGVDYAAR